MTQQQTKSKLLACFEHVLLALCLCTIVLRTTFTEGLNISSLQPISLGSNLQSLLMSTILICAFLAWLLISFCCRQFAYRPTKMEVGLLLFAAAASIAALYASNQRAALTNLITLIAPMLMALLLVQLLDSDEKVKLTLIVIAALGVVAAYNCIFQLFIENPYWIERYKQAPQTLLGPLGIQPGSLNNMLLEHRLYSKGVRGFFTTGNSAGSFALLASFAAIAIFTETYKNHKSKHTPLLYLLTTVIVAATIITGLALTRSKGAITAAILAAAMLLACIFFPAWLKSHKKNPHYPRPVIGRNPGLPGCMVWFNL